MLLLLLLLLLLNSEREYIFQDHYEANMHFIHLITTLLFVIV